MTRVNFTEIMSLMIDRGVHREQPNRFNLLRRRVNEAVRSVVFRMAFIERCALSKSCLQSLDLLVEVSCREGQDNEGDT